MGLKQMSFVEVVPISDLSEVLLDTKAQMPGLAYTQSQILDTKVI